MYLGKLSFRQREKQEQRPWGGNARGTAKSQSVLSSRSQREGTRLAMSSRALQVIIRTLAFILEMQRIWSTQSRDVYKSTYTLKEPLCPLWVTRNVVRVTSSTTKLLKLKLQNSTLAWECRPQECIHMVICFVKMSKVRYRNHNWLRPLDHFLDLSTISPLSVGMATGILGIQLELQIPLV